MRVVPFKGRKGDVVCTIDGALCLFDRRGAQPQAGVEVEVMICSSLPMRWPEGDLDRPKAERVGPSIAGLIVQPVTDDHVLVEHEGFECSGSMCRTTASVTEAGDRAVRARNGRGITWLTPGRTPVLEIGNSNVGWTYRDDAGELRKHEYRKPVSGRAYVSLKDMAGGHQRIAGIADLEQLDPYVSRLLVRRKVDAPRRKPPIDVLDQRRPGVRAAADKARACGELTVADVRASIAQGLRDGLR